MSREIRRVPRGFNWPLKEVWTGYLLPEWLQAPSCSDCEGYGHSPYARHIRDLWYGYRPFSPAKTGSTFLTPQTPKVRAFAERNVASSPRFYGDGERAIVREAARLADLWNGMLCHHLDQEDVDALTDAGRLMEFTHTWTTGEGWKPREPAYRPSAAEVNEWSLDGIGHDAINQMIVTRARCERVGEPEACATCGGHGSIEAFTGQRALAEDGDWQIDPPTGEAWQVWETTSEGSPCSPAFDTRDELIAHLMSDQYSGFGGIPSPLTREQAEAFVDARSSLGSLVVTGDGRMINGDAAVGELS